MDLRRGVLAAALIGTLLGGVAPVASASPTPPTADIRVMTLNIFYGGDELDLQTGNFCHKAAGCLETLASQRGMIQSLRESMSDPPRYPLTFADVVKAADRKLPVWMRDTFDAIATGVSAALNMYGVRRAVLVGRVTELPALATDYLIDVIQRAAMWSRFETVSVTLAPKRISRGLVIAGIHRFVMPTDWSA